MIRRILLIVLVGVMVVGLMTGCSKEIDSKTETPVVNEKNEGETPEPTEGVDRKFSKQEIRDMYGNDEVLIEFVEGRIGTQMPDLRIINKDGKEITLKEDYIGKPFIVEFIGTWCPVCERTVPHVAEFVANSDIPYLMISGDEKLDDVKAFIGDSNIPYFVGANANEFHDTMKLQFVPVSMFVDADGIIQMVTIGEMTAPQINSTANRSFGNE